jgi:hypothetical protein
MASSILNSDDGVISGTSGLKSTGGDDGVLNIQNNGTTAVTVNASGNVGVGTTTPSAGGSGGTTKVLQIDGAAGYSILSLSTTATADQSPCGLLQFCSELGSDDRVAMIVGRKTSASTTVPTGILEFYTANGGTVTERARFTSDGYLRMASGSGGIQFNGDTAAANALDDYEEGTWTPNLRFGSGTTGITYSFQEGRYTKVGNLVTITFSILLSNKGSSSGTANITGMPFGTQHAFLAFLFWSDRVTFTGGVAGGYIGSAGGTAFEFYNQVSGANATISNTAFANDSYVAGSLSYTT